MSTTFLTKFVNAPLGNPYCFHLRHLRCNIHSCLLPLLIRTFIIRFSGYDLLVNGYPVWCPQSQSYWDDPFLVQTLAEYQERQIRRNRFLENFVLMSSVFLAVDISWMVMVWVAASVGTPTQPNGRDEYLR